MALETQSVPECVHDAEADDVAFHVSVIVELFSVTEHVVALLTPQLNLVVAPERIRGGVTVSGVVAVGAGGVTHTPVEQMRPVEHAVIVPVH